MKTLRFLAIFVVTSLLCFGCAPQNVVRLSYPEAPHNVSTTALNVRVCVVDFDDKRSEGAVGERLSGEKLLPRTPVNRWLAASLAEELRRGGYQVFVAETFENALKEQPDFIVTGEADEVWLAESSITRYTGTIRASISLLTGKGEDITKNGYSSVYSKTVLPVYGVPQTLLNEALAEMLHPASRLLVQMMQ